MSHLNPPRWLLDRVLGHEKGSLAMVGAQQAMLCQRLTLRTQSLRSVPSLTATSLVFVGGWDLALSSIPCRSLRPQTKGGMIGSGQDHQRHSHCAR
jgi:hypothetical protein